MTKSLPFLLFAVIAMLGSAKSLASEGLTDCASSRESAVGYLRCLDRRIERLNNDITLWGNNKIFELEGVSKLTGRTDALSLFKKAQKSFHKYRENNCRWQYLLLLPDITAGAISYKECFIKMSETRVAELKQLGKKETAAGL